MKSIVATIFIGLIAIAAVDAHPPAVALENDNNAVTTTITTTTITTNTKQTKEDDSKPITEASAESSATTTTTSNASDEMKTEEKLPIKIYYEGLCPDSRQLLGDLGSEYYMFRKYITLDFVPFGRAKSLDAEGNAFECHHGPKECDANRIHSCGIKYLPSQDARQQFVVCQMRKEADQTGKEVCHSLHIQIYIEFIERKKLMHKLVFFIGVWNFDVFYEFQCLEEAGGDWTTVSKCIDGDEGKKLQLIAENETKEISKPRLENVPTIVFNNVSSL